MKTPQKVLFENEHLFKTMSSVAGSSTRGPPTTSSSTGGPRGGYADVNAQLGRTLSSVDWDEFLSTVVPCPQTSFAQAYSYSAPTSDATFFHHKTGIRQQVPLHLSNFFRGEELYSADRSSSPATAASTTRKPVLLSGQAIIYRQELGAVDLSLLPCDAVPWSGPVGFDCKQVDWTKEKRLGNNVADVCLALNWTRVGELAESFLIQAKRKFAGRAFVHWFEHYGVERDDFEASFDRVQDVVESYRSCGVGGGTIGSM